MLNMSMNATPDPVFRQMMERVGKKFANHGAVPSNIKNVPFVYVTGDDIDDMDGDLHLRYIVEFYEPYYKDYPFAALFYCIPEVCSPYLAVKHSKTIEEAVKWMKGGSGIYDSHEGSAYQKASTQLIGIEKAGLPVHQW